MREDDVVGMLLRGTVLVVTVALAACSADDAAAPTSTAPTSTSPATASSTTSTSPPASTAPTAAEVGNPTLRSELLAMMDEDQAEQLGQVTTDNYRARTDRLTEILDEYGWPTFDLVGEDGSTAAWVIAQHADLDLEVQQRALELLRAAAMEGQASRGDLAYLEDRVAVATGDDQVYGTQIRCGEDGRPVPATPIADEPAVEERRAVAGLDPLADYIAEMTAICAQDG